MILFSTTWYNWFIVHSQWLMENAELPVLTINYLRLSMNYPQRLPAILFSHHLYFNE